MIEILRGTKEHVEGIVQVCVEAQWATYKDLYSKEYIEKVIKKYYTEHRVSLEVSQNNFYWGGWFVAIDKGEIVGAGGGGMIDESTSELYVLYLKPTRRNEGIGSMLLEAITEQQIGLGANTQWVSVAKGNQKAIPFYEAKGFIYDHEEKSNKASEQENYISLRYRRQIGVNS